MYWHTEVSAVENIEKFSPQFQIAGFLKSKVFGDSQVERCDSRSTKRVASLAASIPKAGQLIQRISKFESQRTVIDLSETNSRV